MKFILTLLLLSLMTLMFAPKAQATELSWWPVQAIDTMKFSRDPSSQYLSNRPELNKVSDQMAKDIAATGATHMVVDTPYDAQFLPVLKTWVAAARKYNLHIWFRGNWSGWENWFGTASITRDEHYQLTKDFITNHPELFEEGDIFSACPECENGGPGDPRLNGDAQGHRDFLIREYQMMSETFRAIGKNVRVNYNSMNGDMAKLIMDKETTQALGGLVVIDHYVQTPNELNYDISQIAKASGGKVVLGEFGAPIPDIHGNMTDRQQADWIRQSLSLLSQNPDLVGLNYWTNMGGSTALWADNGDAKPAVAVISTYFTPHSVSGTVTNTLDDPVNDAIIETTPNTTLLLKGKYQIAYVTDTAPVKLSAPGYETIQTTIAELRKQPNIQLTPTQPGLLYQLRTWFKSLFG